VIGYVRVSTDEQADSGAGLEAQRAAIRAECVRRGWTLQHIYEDAGASGKSLDGRPGLGAALGAVEESKANTLIVAKLDRLSRSVKDWSTLVERSRKRGWELVALDVGVDTTTPQGEMHANVMVSFAQFERRLIGQRTKDALAVKRAEGVRLGRPSRLAPETRQRIVHLRAGGATLQAIADELNASKTPTGHGASAWNHSSVSAVLRAGPTRRLRDQLGLSDTEQSRRTRSKRASVPGGGL